MGWFRIDHANDVYNQSPEDVGEEYLVELTRKSFFDFKETDTEQYYMMHNLLHELACFASLGECVRIKDHYHTNIISTVSIYGFLSLALCLYPCRRKFLI